MERSHTVEEYILKNEGWQRQLMILRDILLHTGLDETIKWGAPVYCWQNKNIAGMAAFKNYVGLWFFQGALLRDPHKKLINAQEGKTNALRQMRFKEISDDDVEIILAYLEEAIENQKAGKEVPLERNKELIIPEVLQKALDENNSLKLAFEKYSKARKREFANHIIAAKRDETKLKRLEKVIPIILDGKGLHDKYR